MLAPDGDEVRRLDDALWLETDGDWLPHGAYPPDDGRTAFCPVWLTAADGDLADRAPNRAEFLFLVGGAPSRHLERFERVFDLFDGHSSEAVEAARQRWRDGRALGLVPSYWRETASGWERAR